MKLRRTKSLGPASEVNIEANVNEEWIPLRKIKSLKEISKSFKAEGELSSDLLAVLQLGKDGWKMLTQELELIAGNFKDSKHENVEASQVLMPFEPTSFREFTLFEKHFTHVSRAHVQRFMPGVFKITRLYEKLTGNTFPKFKPNKLWYKQPLYYYGSHLNFYADGDTIDWPHYVKHLDYELELAAIVSRKVRDISPEEARNAIGGYTVINDFSSRGPEQKMEMDSGCGPQKSKHFANSLSSVVVTADEIVDRETELSGTITINGSKVGSCNSDGMQFSFSEIVSFLSQGQTLFPGELLASGTLPGGSGMETGQLLAQGDEIVLTLENVGEVKNNIS